MTTTLDRKDMKPVLDKGYVRLIDHMGDDLRVINAAKASFARSDEEMTPRGANLIKFLLQEGHFSPLRHSVVTLEFKAPLMVARQHWKYVVGADHTMDGWNESSRRYITEKEEFYIPQPDQWRSAPENKKQGSGEPVDWMVGSEAFQMLMEDVDRQLAHYQWALNHNICAEQARLFLPAYGLYVNYWWTASLQSLTHFLAQRLAHDAQVEIQEYAEAVRFLAEPLFPVTFMHYGF